MEMDGLDFELQSSSDRSEQFDNEL
jgi:hypothetical protein